MFKHLNIAIAEKSKSKSILIISLVLLIITQIIMMSRPLGLAEIESIAPGVKILDAQFNYTNSHAHETIENLGDAGRKAYVNLLITDFFYIFCYTAFSMLTMMAILKRIFPALIFMNFIWLLPFLSGLSDIFENIFNLYQLGHFPNEQLSLYSVSNIFTMFKMVTDIPCEITIVVGSVYLLTMWIIKRNRTGSKVKKSGNSSEKTENNIVYTEDRENIQIR